MLMPPKVPCPAVVPVFVSASRRLRGSGQPGCLAWAGAAIASHVVGSLLLTLAGLATAEWLRR